MAHGILEVWGQRFLYPFDSSWRHEIREGYNLVGPLFERGTIALSEQFSSSEFFETTGLPFLSFFNRGTLDDVASHILPGRVHLLCLGCAAIGSLFLHNRKVRTLICLNAGISVCALLFAEMTVSKFLVKVFSPLVFLQ